MLGFRYPREDFPNTRVRPPHRLRQGRRNSAGMVALCHDRGLLACGAPVPLGLSDQVYIVCSVEHSSSCREHLFTSLSQRDSTRRAFEETNFQHCLQITEVRAHDAF